jgi:K+-sensing histidine kinase KdpD
LNRLQIPRFNETAGLIHRYGVAVLVTGVILLASIALRQVLEDAVPLVLFILAVMVSAWYG